MRHTARLKRGFWSTDRVIELKKLASIMTVIELALKFDVTRRQIQSACGTHEITYLHIGSGRPKKQKSGTPKKITAQESIDLFKNQYQQQTINQLLTKPWSKHEQIRLN